MKAGHILFLVLMFLIMAGTADIHAQSPDAPGQTVGISTLDRFDFSTNAFPSKFDLKYTEYSSDVEPCVPLESGNPVCTEQSVSFCSPTPAPSEQDPINQPLTAEPLVPEPTLAEVETIENQPQTTDVTPLPTMAPLENQYASADAILDSDKIFNLVNQYRGSRGLAVFERNDAVCELAQTRSSEIITEIGNGTLHSGLYNRPLPYWIFENAKYGSNEEGTVAWWLASPIHHHSIVSDYKYSCVKCTGSYCTQLFTSFSPKQTASSEPSL